MTLRNQLTVLAAVTCVPLLLFAAILIFLLNRHFINVEQDRLTYIAQHVAADIDREISATIRTLEVLATSDYLDKGDLRGFHRQALHALVAIRPWEAIVLTDAAGQQIANTRRPFGSLLPMTGTPDFNAAIVKTRRMAVSNLFSGGVVKTPVIAVGVPVIREGQVLYTLSSSTTPTFLTDLLKKSNLPAGWLATVIDRNQIIVARTLNIDKYLGQAATPLFAAKSKEASRGLFKGSTREGIDVSTAYQRSELTGWTVAVAIPTSLLQAAERRFILPLSVGGVLLLLLGFALAYYFGQRITSAIAGLTIGAEALGRGETPLPLRTRIAEVNRVAQAMEHAGVARQQSEEALRKSEANLTAAQAQARLGSWEQNLATQTGWWSAEMYRLFDREPGRGAPALAEFLEWIHPEDRAIVEQARTQVIQGSEDVNIEIRSDPRRGPKRDFKLLVGAVRDPATGVARLAGTVQDITEYKLAQLALLRAREHLEEQVNERTRDLVESNLQLQGLDRLKSQFLANMSHELRTPLNAIIGFSQLMYDGKAGPVSDEHKEFLNDILDSGKHLLQLIEDVLDLSKVEAGRMALVKSTFPIDELLVEVVQNVAPIMSVKGLKLIRDIPPDLPPITTDRRKLLQILLNLASNAVKFTDHGEIRISCRIKSGIMQLSVSDTGIGIKAEQLPLLFQPFVQLDDSLQKRHQGTGLGLHLSKKLADLLGGEMTVESEYGKGSTFTLTIPVAQ